MVSEFATRFTGSSDLYEWSSRRPHASINFVTCHDGFTLHDLVSYNDKHNEANGEDNRDGDNNNNSWNCGVEGPTDDPAINELREKKKRNILATLAALPGRADAPGRRRDRPHAAGQQQRLLPGQRADLAPLGPGRAQDRPLEVRPPRDRASSTSSPSFTAAASFTARRSKGAEAPEISWLDPSGQEMTEQAWKDSFVRCLGVQLFGGEIDVDEHGEPIVGDTHAADVQRRPRQHDPLHAAAR